jgi:hypothetical protein
MESAWSVSQRLIGPAPILPPTVRPARSASNVSWRHRRVLATSTDRTPTDSARHSPTPGGDASPPAWI